MSRKKNLIAYCSPNGGTRLAAETIGGTLEKYNHQVTYLDLGTGENRSRTGQVNIDEYSCLWVGSPIYSNHALPPVMTFISGLEPGKATSAAVFVTYGLATSGLGMMEMGLALMDKGYPLLGAAKVPAVHSMLWRSDKPLGQGRPNESDLTLIRDLAGKVALKLDGPDPTRGLSAGDLAYQPERLLDKFNSGLAELKKIAPPIKLDEVVCTECGICADLCPTANITLSPLPVFDTKCVLCLSCVRNCEPGALDNDMLKVVEGRILQRREEFAEPDETRIFF